MKRIRVFGLILALALVACEKDERAIDIDVAAESIDAQTVAIVVRNDGTRDVALSACDDGLFVRVERWTGGEWDWVAVLNHPDGFECQGSDLTGYGLSPGAELRASGEVTSAGRYRFAVQRRIPTEDPFAIETELIYSNTVEI